MTYIQNKKIQNYIHNVDTSFTKEVISTTIEYYPGTEVVYTPVSGATKVVYECSLQVAWTPDTDASQLSSRLQYSDDNGSTWNDIDNTNLFEGSRSSTADYDWYNYFWIFSVSAWSGERKLRLAGRAFNSSREATIGRSYNANATEGVGSCPHVSIYSII